MSQVKTYRSSRLKAAGVIFFFAAFAGFGLFIIPWQRLLGWAILLFSGAFALLVLAGTLAGGSSLSLGRKGFEIASLFKRTRVRWDEIEALQVTELKRTRVIAVKYKPGRNNGSVSRALTGMDLAIANAYGVALQELCGAMNDCRNQYMGSVPGQVAPVAAPQDDARPAPLDKPARVFLLAFCAAFLVLLLNVVLRVVLHLQGTPVTLGIAFAVGGCVMVWFLKGVKRPPSPQERASFLGAYGALIVVPYLGIFLWASATRGFNPSALIILALHSLAYLVAAQLSISEKRFSAMVAKHG